MAEGVVTVELAGDGEVPLDRDARTTASTTTFAALYDAQFLAMVRLAVLLGARPEQARDIVQDAFVGLHLRWSSVREPTAYLRRSVVNGCRSALRWERRRRGRRTSTEDSVGLDVDHTLAVLARLPHRQRAAVVLKFYEGRTEDEIARALGCRPGSVGPMVHRALSTLKEALR
jgi:DNA-directed RNA polymerase specialized sigma24 family protein